MTHFYITFLLLVNSFVDSFGDLEAESSNLSSKNSLDAAFTVRQHGNVSSNINHEERYIINPSDPIAKFKLSIVMPFHIQSANQMERLFGNLNRWLKFPPCHESLPGAEFLFMYSVISNETEQDKVRRESNRNLISAFWSKIPSAVKCFGPRPKFVEMPLKQEDDYHPFCTCVLFYQTFETLKNRSDNWFQMEGDVLPIQPGWAEIPLAIASRNSHCEQFWEAGSRSNTRWQYGRNSERLDKHLNGNAMYCLADDAFRDYLKRVREFFPNDENSKMEDRAKDLTNGCRPGNDAPPEESGFDHTIYQYRTHPNTQRYSYNIMNKFIETGFIGNFGEDEYDEDQLRREHPEVTLAHSKFPMLNVVRQEIVRLFWDVLREYPPWNFKYPKSLSGIEAITKDLCKKRHRRRVFDFKPVHEKMFCEVTGEPPHYHSDPPVWRAADCAQKCGETLSGHPKTFAFAFKTITRQSRGLVPSKKACVCFHNMCTAPKNHNGYNLYTANLQPWPKRCLHLKAGDKLINKISPDLYFSQGIILQTSVVPGVTETSRGIIEEAGGILFSVNAKLYGNDRRARFGLEPCPSLAMKRAHLILQLDPEIPRTDVIVCTNPSSHCEMFMFLAKVKHIVIYVTNRLNFGRYDPEIEWRKPYLIKRSKDRFLEWIENLKRLHKAGATVAASNAYDQQYIEFATGIRSMVIPPVHSTEYSYSPIDDSVLLICGADGPSYIQTETRQNIGRSQIILNAIVKSMEKINKMKNSFIVKTFSEAHGKERLSLSLIARHRAVIYIPLQASDHILSKLYSMSIPIFTPILDLLKKWNISLGIEEDAQRLRDVKRDGIIDPELLDIFHLPHIQVFSSLEDLSVQLQESDLPEISSRMRLHNYLRRTIAKSHWTEIISKGKEMRKLSLTDGSLSKALSHTSLENGTNLALDISDFRLPSDSASFCRQGTLTWFDDVPKNWKSKPMTYAYSSDRSSRISFKNGQLIYEKFSDGVWKPSESPPKGFGNKLKQKWLGIEGSGGSGSGMNIIVILSYLFQFLFGMALMSLVVLATMRLFTKGASMKKLRGLFSW
eukprot:CAMPEP_0167749404 /NCGR_PEP_ID=MMETSP0110_2-20121227/5388_1 /TAXON_ID=629695 /ORGANISM="Gymnochlora sp., Strain CCMP2014" /LENGTH=1062 /DNA_ID=CAMNT_0007634553 /DNA_START=898 /DNA_END=4083 /DNA_ORIENTATION=+